MRYVSLGRTGVRVSELCLGTMTFGNEADEDTSIQLMNHALDVGINFFDTANIYNKGLTEEIVGRWLGPHRQDLILASKVHFATGPGVNDQGSSRRHILHEVEQSLKRLQTDWLDILYVHRWDESTPIEETLAAMTTLVEQGKVHYCGVSNFSAWQAMKAISVAAAGGYAPISCIQPMYNLVKRQAEVEILPMAASEGLAVCPYNPMAAGLLTGKYQRGESGRLHESDMYKERYKYPEYADACDRFVAYAGEKGVSPAALAVAWVKSHPAVTSAIIGARNLDQMDDTLACLEIDITAEMREEIAGLSPAPASATDRNEERVPGKGMR